MDSEYSSILNLAGRDGSAADLAVHEIRDGNENPNLCKMRTRRTSLTGASPVDCASRQHATRVKKSLTSPQTFEGAMRQCTKAANGTPSDSVAR